MRLDAYGWTPALDFHLEQLGEATWLPGRVSRLDRGRALVVTASGEHPATWRSPIPVPDAEPIDAPVIGDWCAVSEHAGLLRIETVLPRATSIARGVASGRRATHVLAANVDVTFIVTGLDADFSVRRIERYLALARSGGARPVLVLNKTDLCDQVNARLSEVERVAPGIIVIGLSALADDVARSLGEHLGPGKTAVFLGSSGAGKSTLINCLLGEERQSTAPVRDADSRGRHTTTRRELLLIEGIGAVIDTPGLREVGLMADEESLELAFEEIAALASGCRFGNCRHEREPGCAVRAAVDTGTLDAARLDSYLRLRREAESARLRQDAYASRRQERRTIGHYKKWLRETYKLKGRS